LAFRQSHRHPRTDRGQHRIGEPSLHRAPSVSRPVCASADRDTCRTFLIREISGGARNPETRGATSPNRALFGTGGAAIRTSLVAPETGNARNYTLETVDPSHSVIDERPNLVRAKLIAVAEETSR